MTGKNCYDCVRNLTNHPGLRKDLTSDERDSVGLKLCQDCGVPCVQGLMVD